MKLNEFFCLQPHGKKAKNWWRLGKKGKNRKTKKSAVFFLRLVFFSGTQKEKKNGRNRK